MVDFPSKTDEEHFCNGNNNGNCRCEDVKWNIGVGVTTAQSRTNFANLDGSVDD